MDEKFEFASPKWIELALEIVKKLVGDAGEKAEGVKFSVCETYTNAPSHIAQKDGKIAWYFRIEGKNVETGHGEYDNVDFKVLGDYEEVKKISKLVYGQPGVQEELDRISKDAYKAGKLKAVGSNKNGPKFLMPMHNMLAKRTQ